jgi:hypothetical protein
LPHALFWKCCFTRYGGEFEPDLASSLLIGEKLADVAGGQAADVENTILLD